MNHDVKVKHKPKCSWHYRVQSFLSSTTLKQGIVGETHELNRYANGSTMNID